MREFETKKKMRERYSRVCMYALLLPDLDVCDTEVDYEKNKK